MERIQVQFTKQTEREALRLVHLLRTAGFKVDGRLMVAQVRRGQPPIINILSPYGRQDSSSGEIGHRGAARPLPPGSLPEQLRRAIRDWFGRDVRGQFKVTLADARGQKLSLEEDDAETDQDAPTLKLSKEELAAALGEDPDEPTQPHAVLPTKPPPIPKKKAKSTKRKPKKP